MLKPISASNLCGLLYGSTGELMVKPVIPASNTQGKIQSVSVHGLNVHIAPHNF